VTEISDWSQSPAGLMRNRGIVTRKDAAQVAMEIASPDRVEAHRALHEAWGPVLTVQEALVKRGWTGQFIDIPGPLVPPEPAPLHAAAAAAQSRIGTRTPAGDDPVLAEMVAAERERIAAAQEAQNGRLSATAYATTPYNIHQSVQ
jgi:hypothetical protein